MRPGTRVRGSTKSASRRGGRLVELGMAAGALWLTFHRGQLSLLSESLGGMLEGTGLASALLEQELQLPAPPATTEELLLEQLPRTEAREAESPPEEPEQTPEPEAQPEEPEEGGSAPWQPLSGALDAPEEELEPEEPEVSRPVIEPVSVDPDALELTNSTDGIDLELGDYLSRELPLTVSAEGPQILIMHTHATEAYTMADGDDYTPSDTSRTTDEQYNMIRVGEEMKDVFEEMGLSVIHDKTLYDYPSYTGSYARSLKGIQSCLEQYPTISVVLDVHRDAMIASDGTAYKVTDTIDGKTVAQVMLVVGTNDGGLEHPGWEKNVTLAAYIQARMLAIDSGFPRPVNLRSQRFNQHMTAGSLLVEVGTSGNTLQEALAGARLFAKAAGEVYLSCMEDP